jgi:hypothetical protein
MVVLKAHNQWKKFLLTLKNQHKVEVTNMPNADLKIFWQVNWLIRTQHWFIADSYRKPRKG